MIKFPSLSLRGPKLYGALFLSILLGLFMGASLAHNPKTPDLHSQIVNRAQNISESDQIIIKFKSSDHGRQNLILESQGLSQKKNNSRLGLNIVKIPKGKKADEVLGELKNRYAQDIEYAEVDSIVLPVYATNDPYLGSQWHHTMIKSSQAWDLNRHTDIVVAIADTGIDMDHPDLVQSIVGGYNVVLNNSVVDDVNGHGTMVAGTAAAIGNNGNQVAGVAFDAKILPIKVSENADGSAYFSDLIEAITYAADHNAKIVNVSYGPLCTSTSITDAAQYMQSKGGIVVAAAGNEGNEYNCGDNPAIVFVSATDQNDVKTSWSSYGAYVDVSAPGASILTTINGGGIGYTNGTSFSSPMTAGLLALIWGSDLTLSANQVEQILKDGAQDLGTSGNDKLYGWGRIDAYKSVQLAQQINSDPDTVAPQVMITNPQEGFLLSSKGSFAISAEASDDRGVESIRILLDGVLQKECLQTNLCEITINSRQVEAGIHIIEAIAKDNAGNSDVDSINISKEAKGDGGGGGGGGGKPSGKGKPQ